MFFMYMVVVIILNSIGFDFTPLVTWFNEVFNVSVTGVTLFWIGFVIALLVD